MKWKYFLQPTNSFRKKVMKLYVCRNFRQEEIGSISNITVKLIYLVINIYSDSILERNEIIVYCFLGMPREKFNRGFKNNFHLENEPVENIVVKDQTFVTVQILY